MKHIALAIFVIALSARVAPAAEIGTWRQLPPLPDPLGVAGPFAGVSHGALVVAGGASFPEKKPWEGGKKVWHETIFMLAAGDEPEWKIAGHLPHPIAYGVSVTLDDALLCIGGSDSQRHHADVFKLSWMRDPPQEQTYPPLPIPIANACGVLAGHDLYIVGGQEKPDSPTALASLFRLDVTADKLKWEKLDDCPGGGRIFAVAASVNDDLYVFGGAELSPGVDGKPNRGYRTDAWRFHPGKGWSQLPDLPQPVVAAPSPAPVDSKGRILVLGGDDGSQVGVTRPAEHKGFSKSILRFDPEAKKWETIADAIPVPRVTVPCVRWNGAGFVIPSGERVPGIRSPEVWSFNPLPEE